MAFWCEVDLRLSITWRLVMQDLCLTSLPLLPSSGTLPEIDLVSLILLNQITPLLHLLLFKYNKEVSVESHWLWSRQNSFWTIGFHLNVLIIISCLCVGDENTDWLTCISNLCPWMINMGLKTSGPQIMLSKWMLKWSEMKNSLYILYASLFQYKIFRVKIFQNKDRQTQP